MDATLAGKASTGHIPHSLITHTISSLKISTLCSVAAGFFNAYKNLRDCDILKEAVRLAQECDGRLLITGHRYA